MDYRDQDGNGEGLYGARNENSVLFSLDSLTSLDKDSSANPAGSGFGSSGDASGLIDLNTLAKMSNSGSGTGDNDEEMDAPVMKSVVFNQVVTKKNKRRIWIVVGILALVFAGIAVGGYFMYSSFEEKAIAQAKENEEQQAMAQKKAQELQDQLDKLEEQKKSLESDLQNREASQAEIQKAMEKLQQQKEALLANGPAPTDSKPTGSKPSSKPSSGSSAPSAPAAPKTKAPDKGELLKALKEANSKAAKCGKGGSLSVSFNLTNNTAKGVKANGGSFAGTATEKCILTVIEKHRWPDGVASGIKYTIKL